MKKTFSIIFFACTFSIYSQTWIECLNPGTHFGVGSLIHECTVITLQDFNRLVQQHKESSDTCNITYTDKLEITYYPVISGTRPTFSGRYYILIKETGWAYRNSTFLVYGDSKTGKMEIEFFSKGGINTGNFRPNSDEFTKHWNKYLSWVEGR